MRQYLIIFLLVSLLQSAISLKDSHPKEVVREEYIDEIDQMGDIEGEVEKQKLEENEDLDKE